MRGQVFAVTAAFLEEVNSEQIIYISMDVKKDYIAFFVRLLPQV